MRILLDTNLLIYAHDPTDLTKQHKAIWLLNHSYVITNGCFSVQSLSEFFSVITRPKKGDPPRLSIEEALIQTDVICSTFPIFDLTPEIVLTAGRGVRDYRLAYYDAQIWATALMNGVSVIFSEDFQDHTSIEGIKFINPLLPEFNIEDWA